MSGAGSIMVRVKSPQDFGAGIVFILIGVAGLMFGRDLAMGTSARMGPGYFPALLSCSIIVLGAIVGARGLTVEGPELEKFHFRPLGFVIASILASGYLMGWFGLAITTVIVTLIAAYARPQVNLRETLLLGIGMALFAVFVFVYALGQPLPAWWGR
jgi:hypothetical protein